MILKLLKMPLFAIILLLATIICFPSYAFDPNFDFWVAIDGPNHILPNQQNIMYVANPHNAEGSCTYSWSGGGTGSSYDYNAGASGQNTISCTVKDSVNPPDSASKTIKICNVTSVTTDNDKTAIMKGGSENITITASLYCILPAGGQIEWQRKFNDSSTWTVIGGQTETERSLTSSESVGKYKYRARVIGNTGDVGWEESGDLIVYDIRIIKDIDDDNDDITDDTTEVWAGEKISLTAVIIPDDSGLTMENISWNIPEVRIKDYEIPLSTNSAHVTELSDSYLNVNNIDFYWVDGNENGMPKTIIYTAKICNQDIEQQAGFSVKKPDNELRWNLGNVICGSDYKDSDDKVWLSLGLCISTHAGIKGWHRGSGPLEGELVWIPVVNISYHVYNFPYPDVFCFEYGLDKGFYDGNWWDSPGIRETWHTYRLYRLDIFHTVLMFKPDKPDSIYVPMNRLRWSWSGDATWHFPAEWDLTESSKHVEIQDNLNFPVWNKILYNK